jgi:predicted nucleic acid-binding protein
MDWFMAADEHSLSTSCIVLGEIKKGIMLLPDGERRSKFEELLTEIMESFDGRVLEVNQQTALIWGELLATGQQSGKTPPVIDALIAAQCTAHNLTLVTRNVKDFELFPKLKVLSPWSE